jgi:hypothetical protein
MQVRLAFSIAIRAKSDILVLDEVLAVGDAAFQKKCFDYFRKLKDESKTVILVSHSMDSIKKFCDRALMLEHGEIVAIGDPEEVSDKYIWSNMEQERKTEPKSPEEVEGQGIIKSVHLQNKNDVAVREFVSGNPLKFAIKYDASKEPGEVNFGVGLYLDTGGYVFGYNTQMDNFKLNGKAGTLVLNFNKMPILSGTYRVNIICFGADETAPLDFRPRALEFNVSAIGTASGYRGLVEIEHDWQQ